MNKALKCPVCKSKSMQQIYLQHFGRCITSDMKVLENAELDNRICKECGLIYNQKGTREFTENFYKSSYSLMVGTSNAKITSFAAKKPISQAELTFNILNEKLDLQKGGKILEAGAGKGEFLKYFKAAHSNWEITAFESSTSFEFLKADNPEATTLKCQYEEFTSDEKFDLIVALGVLEHVQDPLDMLDWAHSKLIEGGIFYIRVPNFEINPNDLFCADHLSKLTFSSLKAIANKAGFKVKFKLEKGVPIFILLEKQEESLTLKNCYSENLKIVEKNSEIASSSMDAIVEARNYANKTGENFAIFGLGSVGLFAPFYGDFDSNEITVYLDENQSVWGKKIHNKEVVGLDYIKKLNIKHIALAISPVYYDVVKEKLMKYGVKVYCSK
tara:strand:+ start:2477 stop:3634 length:1158 start_codon:yes stop_codon:yes gene_type:complete